MPELPEVETIRRELQRVLPGAAIRRVLVHLPKIVKLSHRTFLARVEGSKIAAVRRRAKLVRIDLDHGWTIIIHLKMTGQLIWQPPHGHLVVGGHPIPGGIETLPNKYSHVIFQTSKGTLYFNDQRQFGFVKLFRTAAVEPWFKVQGYGPEPLDRQFTLTVFEALLNRHAKKKIKPTLMDQTVVAGVGNIYADEACFAAKVRPMRRIATLTAKERRDLYHGLLAVLKLAISKKGTTADNYRTSTGRPGGMLPYLKVYQRAGQRCKRCRGTIVKITLAGRGTHYCPRCQK